MSLLHALLVVAPSVLTGQAPPPLPVFTLHQAVEYARAHQPSLRASQARVAVARLEARVPRAAWLPRVALGAELLGGTSNNTTASYVTPPGMDVVRIGGTPADSTISWAPAASTLIGIGLRQEVYDFGRLSAQAAASDFLAAAVSEHSALELLDADLFVEEAYFGVRAAKEVLRASEAAFQRAQTHRELAAAGVKSGMRSPIELTRAEADLARFEVGRVRAAGSLDAARSVLSAAIGASAPGTDTADEPVEFPPPPPLEQVLGGLAQTDPALRESQRRLAAQQQRSAAISAELRPDLAFSAGLNARAGGAPISGRPELVGSGFLPVVPNWDGVLVLSWSVLDPVVWARAAVSRQEEEVRSAEVDLVAERARSAAQQAYIEEQIARATVPALERSLEAAKANHAQADARFKAGLGTGVELADAEALLTDAEIQLAIGNFTQVRARARLGRAISEAAP